MISGAITNSWRLQLESRHVRELIGEAERRGARHVELRQTCLGDLETGEGEAWRPVVPRLRALAADFPKLSFDLAMAWPCLSAKSDPRGPAFQAALEGAKAVGGSTPHLRLVDPARFEAEWKAPEDIPAEALAIADLATEAARQGVVLSMENSGQPIRSMGLLVSCATDTMDEGYASFLGLCPDPTNQLRLEPEGDPLDDLDGLAPEVIKIVHFKQARDGQPHPTVDTGDLDCARMASILRAKGFEGPAVMEIPPDADVFDNLESSLSFLGLL